MIIQEEKVEIVEEQKDQNQEFKNINFEPDSGHTKRILMYVGIFVGILLVLLLVIFGAFTFYNLSNNDKIAKGVHIYGIDVSGLNKSDATKKISSKFEEIQKTDIKLISKQYETTYETYINSQEISLKFNIESAVNYAFSIGKNGNVFSDNYDVFNTMLNGIDITPTYTLDEEALTKLLNELSKNLPDAVEESSYYIEGSTLIVTKGKEGSVVVPAQTIPSIKTRLTDLSFLSEPVELTLTKQKPKEVDLDAIYKEVHKDAKDAYYTTNPYAVYPSSTGVDFKISLEEAKKKLANSENECKIALKTVYPKVTTNMLGREAFPNLLGSFSTNYAANANRTTNLKLAAKKINGTVLLPGETFSYNKVVGERTIAAGYKDAKIYVDGEVVDGLGGGICQISTTLFNAALYANLEIVELHNHQFVPSYVGAGRDATVVYGSKDFQFKNNRKYAIKIECSVSGGVANFKIYGVKENPEYDIKVSSKITSQTATYTKSVTYRTRSLKGKQVSREVVYYCTYKNH